MWWIREEVTLWRGRTCEKYNSNSATWWWGPRWSWQSLECQRIEGGEKKWTRSYPMLQEERHTFGLIQTPIGCAASPYQFHVLGLAWGFSTSSHCSQPPRMLSLRFCSSLCATYGHWNSPPQKMWSDWSGLFVNKSNGSVFHCKSRRLLNPDSVPILPSFLQHSFPHYTTLKRSFRLGKPTIKVYMDKPSQTRWLHFF